MPSAQLIDARAAGHSQQDLTRPPDMAMATVETNPSLYTAETVDAVPSTMLSPEAAAAPQVELQEAPPAKHQATWTVRYRDGGFDAESADGGMCSGRSDVGAASLTRSRPVELACNDGRLASLVIEGFRGSEALGSLNFGKSRDTAVIIIAQ